MSTQTSAKSELLERYGLYFSWLIALFATGGSLYFSEIMGFGPCTLCWVQRIFMYPLVVILGIASYRNDRQIITYVLPLTLIGGCIALFQYLQQKIPALASAVPCKVGVPCNFEYINWFGFVTIPFLSLTAFTLITIILWLSRASNPNK
ncbi:disulfide oxidoreductase [Hazenella coriacea]|uniref:Disulfide bond formation protein DsbB n=1 Tax=Hazenella coriacea TaxID=1179467 RepID=A0A4R3LBT8_9BACL|nr:disulfide oxidoreductase [Hazenella coriacea]TCS96695.1 disulfide bond formation protein DsbB [Hazenella coriacea]